MKRQHIINLLFALAIPLCLWMAMQNYMNGLLNDKGVQFQSQNSSFNQIEWREITYGTYKADKLTLSILPPQLDIYELQINFSTDINKLDKSKPSASPAQLPNWLPLFLHNGHVKSTLINQRISGQISPELDLKGDDIHFTGTKEQLSWSFKYPLKWEGLDGTIQLEGQLKDGDISGTGHIEILTIKSDFLSKSSLQIPDINIIGQFSDDNLKLKIQSNTSYISLKSQMPNVTDYTVEVEEFHLSLSEISQWWGISEEQNCTLNGYFIGKGTLHWPSRQWSIKLDVDSLESNGNLFNPQALREGVFSYLPLNGKGLRETGPATSNWSEDIGWMDRAVTAAEDSRFFLHSGWDIEGIQIAFDEWSSGNSNPRGGSTITQQLAKNLFTGDEHRVSRKIQELIYTLELERLFTKEELLILYLNIVEFGPNIYGIKDASERYFVKAPAQLLPEEAAYLAALLPSPKSGYRQALRGSFRKSRRHSILQNMVDMGSLSNHEHQAALRRPLMVIPPSEQ
jgi:hypothetical protein